MPDTVFFLCLLVIAGIAVNGIGGTISCENLRPSQFMGQEDLSVCVDVPSTLGVA